ncbi:prephenate dehydrogenase [Streptomyces aureoversilis]|uniref:Prephenate dehydrogenase n=2 Tax=Streptomyces aureoversilis TaxID=67277 RepID=A0ABW0A4I0_9ACTN
MIRTMAVVGTGLIGTSVGLAVSRHGVTVHLMDEDETAARTAAALGAGVLAAPAGPVDLAVLAVPPGRLGPVLAEQQLRGLARAYTDVASVKAAPERHALAGLADASSYVGGHPLAGREKSGPLAARADLFEDRSWVLTPSEATSQETLNRALETIALCGAVPVLMGSQAHDSAVALTSHVPHVVASLMAARLQHAPREAARLAGQGLRDVTRIAAGDARLWGDILQSNAAAVAGVLRELQTDLSDLLAALNELSAAPAGEPSPGLARLVDLLDRGIAGMGTIQGRGGAQAAGPVRLRVALGDRPGELARMLASVADFGIGADDVSPRSGGASGLEVELGVAPLSAEDVLRRLVRDGFEAARADRRVLTGAMP